MKLLVALNNDFNINRIVVYYVRDATSEPGFHELLIKAIEAYNKYRGAEARCYLEGAENNEITVRFEGPFCLTCGVIDWVEDFVYILRDLGVEAKINNVEHHADKGYLVAKIRLHAPTPQV